MREQPQKWVVIGCNQKGDDCAGYISAISRAAALEARLHGVEVERDALREFLRGLYGWHEGDGGESPWDFLQRYGPEQAAKDMRDEKISDIESLLSAEARIAALEGALREIAEYPKANTHTGAPYWSADAENMVRTAARALLSPAPDPK